MTTKRKPLFERLSQSLEEGTLYAKGELTLRTVEIPEEPPEITGKTLASLRKQAAMSQAVFAKLLNVSARTVQSWEQGVRQPSDASRRLLQVFCEYPEVVCKTAGLPAVQLHGVTIQHLSGGRRKIVIKRSGKTKAARQNNV